MRQGMGAAGEGAAEASRAGADLGTGGCVRGRLGLLSFGSGLVRPPASMPSPSLESGCCHLLSGEQSAYLAVWKILRPVLGWGMALPLDLAC